MMGVVVTASWTCDRCAEYVNTEVDVDDLKKSGPTRPPLWVEVCVAYEQGVWLKDDVKTLCVTCFGEFGKFVNNVATNIFAGAPSAILCTECGLPYDECQLSGTVPQVEATHGFCTYCGFTLNDCTPESNCRRHR
jgi:hypothetical protein